VGQVPGHALRRRCPPGTSSRAMYDLLVLSQFAGGLDP
jgi:hypothetical protein